MMFESGSRTHSLVPGSGPQPNACLPAAGGCGLRAGLPKGAPFVGKDQRTWPNCMPPRSTWTGLPRIVVERNLPPHPVCGCWRVGTGPGGALSLHREGCLPAPAPLRTPLL